MAIFHSHASFQKGISLDIPWTIPTAIYQKSVNQIIGLDYPLCDFVVAKTCFDGMQHPSKRFQKSNHSLDLPPKDDNDIPTKIHIS